jgi:hypothetical protein
MVNFLKRLRVTLFNCQLFESAVEFLLVFFYVVGHPPPGLPGVLEAALLCFVERNSIEAAVNAVIPAFCIACFRVIFGAPWFLLFFVFFICMLFLLLFQ